MLPIGIIKTKIINYLKKTISIRNFFFLYLDFRISFKILTVHTYIFAACTSNISCLSTGKEVLKSLNFQEVFTFFSLIL